MDSRFTYIQIEKKVRNELKKLKVIPRETWNEVVKRLLKNKSAVNTT